MYGSPYGLLVVCDWNTVTPTECSNCRYKVMVAANNTPSSYKALETAVDLCLRLKCEYKLYIVYFVALNPGRVLPYL